jgi:hypothetical protein
MKPATKLLSAAAIVLFASSTRFPAMAHHAKSDGGSGSIGVSGQVSEYCTFASGLNGSTWTISPWNYVLDTGGTGAGVVTYTCNGGSSDPEIAFSDGLGNVDGGWICQASDGSGDTLFYYLWVANYSNPDGGPGDIPNQPPGLLGCNGVGGSVYPAVPHANGVAESFTVNLVDIVGQPYWTQNPVPQPPPPGSYTGNLYLSLSP